MILDNVCKLVPSLKHAKSVRDWVGLRPYREPVRLQLDHHEVRHPCFSCAMLSVTRSQYTAFCNAYQALQPSVECTAMKLLWRYITVHRLLVLAAALHDVILDKRIAGHACL